MIEGVLAIPINLPFTRFNRGILARKKVVPISLDLICEKRKALEEQKKQANPDKNLITALLDIRNENGSATTSDEEIIDNVILVMVAGYDTTSPSLQQEEIAKSKAPGEALTWEDLTKMKYSRRVASEMLRINPPVNLNFRRAMQDIEYGGFIIPKGWKVVLSQSMTHKNDEIFKDPTKMCTGIELAKMETLAMLHRLVTQFKWELVDNDELFKRNPMPEFDQGLSIRIIPVKGKKNQLQRICEMTIIPKRVLLRMSSAAKGHPHCDPGAGKLTRVAGSGSKGQSLALLKALKDDKVVNWFQKGITKYGPIWKAGLFGYPTVILHGPAANKFIYTYDGNILTSTQPPSISRILGSNNLFELAGHDHKRVRAALASFLKLDVLKRYVGKVDEEIQYHLQTHWHGKHEVQVQPLIKTLTFNIICSLLFGIERGPKRDKLLPHFQYMMEGLLAIPINLPFTQFHRGILARRNLVPMLIDLIREKREALEEQKQQADPHKDLITSLLSIRNDDGSTMMSDEEIIDNIIVVMVGGYDTTSILLTFLVRLLDNNESIYSTIVSEQEEISKSKAPGEALTWEDLTKMKYTWRVASEMMRVNPPAILSFRRAMQDIEYRGFMIPKGWQVVISQSMTHMNNDIFQDPTTFNPTRFEKHAPQPPPYSFVAFGAGPRMCPGIELAKMETLAMMHHLVTQFRWELVDRDESFKRKPMPIFDQGLLVRVTPIKGTFMSSF
ncbi:hypothetical protein LXL04_027094 [Taraxacum kok-saghyz]